MIDFRLGRYQEVLTDAAVDAVITDPPYGERIHRGTNRHVAGSDLPDGADRRRFGYQSWTAKDVLEFVAFWSPRCRGWLACMTSHDLIPAYEQAYALAGRYVFAPVVIISPRPRLIGDGPACWAVYLMVARPKTREYATWGCLPGAYTSTSAREGVLGAKQLVLMQQIVNDYSRPGEIICDPCAGSGSGLIAAYQCGRRSIGSEVDELTYVNTSKRLATVLRSPSIFEPAAQQSKLL